MHYLKFNTKTANKNFPLTRTVSRFPWEFEFVGSNVICSATRRAQNDTILRKMCILQQFLINHLRNQFERKAEVEKDE